LDERSLLGYQYFVELTLEQALQQGAAGHQAGNLEEAERLYRSIQFNLYPASNINTEIINVFRIQE
tara:strand:+ start:1770 stop:1967 length:198 start_codon:yes stop_codon:yes gene_type:complete